MRRLLCVLLALCLAPALLAQAPAPVNPLWHEQKIKNYLPDMTWPEVEALLKRTDMVIIPVAALEQHSLHLPIGTDFLNGVGRAELIAQKTDVLVAPILLPGNSPYHMGFPGTITLPEELIQEVYFQAAKSLIKTGFRRFMFLNSHGGDQAITRFVVDRVNQETEGIAVELGQAAAPFLPRAPRTAGSEPKVFDRHAGVGETSTSLYMFPNLVNMSAARTAKLTMPDHMEKMLPEVVAGDPTATLVFLAEGLKAKETGKKTSTREMSDTGTWGLRDPHEASAAAGERATQEFVDAAVQFIEKWKRLRPMQK